MQIRVLQLAAAPIHIAQVGALLRRARVPVRQVDVCVVMIDVEQRCAMGSEELGQHAGDAWLTIEQLADAEDGVAGQITQLTKGAAKRGSGKQLERHIVTLPRGNAKHAEHGRRDAIGGH